MIGFGPFSSSRRVVAAVGGAPGPDFTIEFQTITNSWGTQTVATLIPNAAAIAAGIRFELVGETAGLAVVNG